MTFRKVGEGTGKSYDIDEYDLYYKHIILWDKNENLIVGAYRIGESNNLKKLKKVIIAKVFLNLAMMQNFFLQIQ
ncbi:GNAT family N-acetyltransferase [Campylobacter sputorum]|uniref:GNAT family N-acetyltransferase n=1 Tax=Campylobacter sputorum TaxID=206 RepID=UPI00385056CC